MADDFNALSTPSGSESAQQTSPPVQSSMVPTPGLNPRSCVTCRKRKVKCDKRNPCGNCTKARIECIFPSPGRAPRKSRKPPDGELMDRLKKLESVVQSLGAQVDDDTLSSPTQQPLPRFNDDQENFQQLRKVADAPGPLQNCNNSGNGIQSSADTNVPGLENRFGRLVVNQGKSRYINSSFWANLNSEVEDLKEIFNEHSDDEEDYPSPSSHPSSNHQSFVFGFSSSNVDMFPLHPSSNLIPKYWSLFKENVEPLAKVLHIPTIEPIIFDAANKLTSLPKGLECLMFVIYYGVVTSLTPTECNRDLGEEKEGLLSRYRFGLEQALARAHFLDSQEMIVLQAFVLFLILLRRNEDARIIWTMTGLVVRIAQTIGIHRDGTHFSLSPFEIEMRRRLWWQVCILDARASEDHGSDPTIVEAQFDTQMPLNVNDSDLQPDMKELPESRKGFTEMTFCLIRFEIANIFRRIIYIPPGPVKCNSFFANLTIEQKEKWITECHQRLEDTYLKHCDMSVPLFWVTATISRLVLSKMWLIVYHPFQRLDGGTSLPQEIKDKLFVTSLESVEYSILLETEQRTRKWEWLFKTYVQWHSLAFMLSELCHRTQGDTVERAWRAIEATVASRFASPNSEPQKAPLWRPLRKLLAKARCARALAIARERSEVQSRSQLAGLPLTNGSHTLDASDHYPTIDALLQRTSSQSFSLSNLIDQACTNGNAGGLQQISAPPNEPIFPPTIPTNNSVAENFNQLSSMGMDWLLGDLTQDQFSGSDQVNWSTFDDMIRQYEPQADQVGGIGTGAAASMGETWY